MLAVACTLAFAVQPRDADDDAVRSLPPDARQAVEGIAQSLMQVHDTDVELSCGKAAENARHGVETMLEVGRKNVDGGYMKRAHFEATAGGLNAMLAQLSEDDCKPASGQKQAFYRCMSSDYNHVLACASAHRY